MHKRAGGRNSPMPLLLAGVLETVTRGGKTPTSVVQQRLAVFCALCAGFVLNMCVNSMFGQIPVQTTSNNAVHDVASVVASPNGLPPKIPQPLRRVVSSVEVAVDVKQDSLAELQPPPSDNGSVDGTLLRKQMALMTELSPQTSADVVEKAVFVGGILKDGSKIKTEHLIFLVQMNCLYGVQIHVLVASNAHALEELYHLQRAELYPHRATTRQQTNLKSCAPFRAETQRRLTTSSRARIDILTEVREMQRSRIGEIWNSTKSSSSDAEAVVILIDMDLLELPPASQVMGLAANMIRDSSKATNIDVLCAAGAVVNVRNGMDGYYDWYATILLPDTFIYPLDRRIVKSPRPEEDPTLIMKDGKDVELLEWMQKQGGEAIEDVYGLATLSPLPARSCFGGLALYRASTYLDSRCTYSDFDEETRIKYGDQRERKPCEHVTLHECLFRHGAKLAIQPDLRTRWVWNSAPHNPVNLGLASTKFANLHQKHKE